MRGGVKRWEKWKRKMVVLEKPRNKRAGP